MFNFSPDKGIATAGNAATEQQTPIIDDSSTRAQEDAFAQDDILNKFSQKLFGLNYAELNDDQKADFAKAHDEKMKQDVYGGNF